MSATVDVDDLIIKLYKSAAIIDKYPEAMYTAAQVSRLFKEFADGLYETKSKLENSVKW